MTSKEALAYLATQTDRCDDPERAQAAIEVLAALAETATKLAEMHEAETRAKGA